MGIRSLTSISRDQGMSHIFRNEKSLLIYQCITFQTFHAGWLIVAIVLIIILHKLRSFVMEKRITSIENNFNKKIYICINSDKRKIKENE